MARRRRALRILQGTMTACLLAAWPHCAVQARPCHLVVVPDDKSGLAARHTSGRAMLMAPHAAPAHALDRKWGLVRARGLDAAAAPAETEAAGPVPGGDTPVGGGEGGWDNKRERRYVAGIGKRKEDEQEFLLYSSQGVHSGAIVGFGLGALILALLTCVVFGRKCWTRLLPHPAAPPGLDRGAGPSAALGSATEGNAELANLYKGHLGVPCPCSCPSVPEGKAEAVLRCRGCQSLLGFTPPAVSAAPTVLCLFQPGPSESQGGGPDDGTVCSNGAPGTGRVCVLLKAVDAGHDRRPVVLPCGHSVCADCGSKALEGTPATALGWGPVGKVTGPFPVNYTALPLLADLQAAQHGAAPLATRTAPYPAPGASCLTVAARVPGDGIGSGGGDEARGAARQGVAVEVARASGDGVACIGEDPEATQCQICCEEFVPGLEPGPLSKVSAGGGGRRGAAVAPDKRPIVLPCGHTACAACVRAGHVRLRCRCFRRCAWPLNQANYFVLNDLVVGLLALRELRTTESHEPAV